MTYRQMSYFIEIVRLNSFTRAAETLFVSQSALSKSVRALEEELGTELINHGGKDIALTESGKAAYTCFLEIMEFSNDKIETLKHQINVENVSLRLGLPPTAGTIYFSAMLSEFRSMYPENKLEITEIPSKELIKLVENDNLDIGVVIEPFDDERFVKRKVFSSEVMVAVSMDHPLADRDAIDASMLNGEKMLLISKEYMFHDAVLNYLETAGVDTEIVFESSQWDMLLEMAADGQGITLVAKPLIDKYYNARIHQIRLTKPQFPWSLTVIYRKGKLLTLPMKRFLKLCDQSAEQ